MSTGYPSSDRTADQLATPPRSLPPGSRHQIAPTSHLKPLLASNRCSLEPNTTVVVSGPQNGSEAQEAQ